MAGTVRTATSALPQTAKPPPCGYSNPLPPPRLPVPEPPDRVERRSFPPPENTASASPARTGRYTPARTPTMRGTGLPTPPRPAPVQAVASDRRSPSYPHMAGRLPARLQSPRSGGSVRSGRRAADSPQNTGAAGRRGMSPPPTFLSAPAPAPAGQASGHRSRAPAAPSGSAVAETHGTPDRQAKRGVPGYRRKPPAWAHLLSHRLPTGASRVYLTSMRLHAVSPFSSVTSARTYVSPSRKL